MKKFRTLTVSGSLRIRWASESVTETVFLMMFGSRRKSVRNLWCTDLLVEVEAHLEFDKMPSLDTRALITRIETMCQSLQEALGAPGRGRMLQSGLQVGL